MKKSLRAVFAAMLAAVMAFTGLTAFAAEDSNTLDWDYYGSTYSYDYAGELVEGTNALKATPEDSYFVYYIFNAENAGFYTISYNEYEISGWFGIPEKVENGVAYDEAEHIYFGNGDEETRYLLKFGEGENIIAFDLNEAVPENTEFTIEYCGEEITGLTFIDGTGENLIIESDIFAWEEEGKFYTEFTASANLEFSSGETIELADRWFFCNLENDLKEGENTVTYNVLGTSLESTVICRNLSYYVKDAEFKDVDSYNEVAGDYNGYLFDSIGSGTVTLTLSDGTKHDLEFTPEEDASITLPNGREYYIYVIYNYHEEYDVAIEVYVGNISVKEYPCSVKSLSFEENLGSLANDNLSDIKDSSYYFRRAIGKLISSYDYEDFQNNLSYAQYLLEEAVYYLFSVLGNISTFINYYI